MRGPPTVPLLAAQERAGGISVTCSVQLTTWAAFLLGDDMKGNAVTRRSTLLSLNSTSPLRFFPLCICRSERPAGGLKATCALHVVSPSFVCHFFLSLALSIWKKRWSLPRKHTRPSTVHGPHNMEGGNLRLRTIGTGEHGLSHE
jgi:hypothetical protein